MLSTLRLYKFIEAKYLESVIDDGNLKVSVISELNDPFEFLPVTKSEIIEPQSFNNFKKGMSAEYGILCFSEKYDNPLLWTHYADNHKGVALGFDVSIRDSIKVDYISDRPEVVVCEKSGKILAWDTIRLLIKSKYIDWKYESEFRKFVKVSECVAKGKLLFRQFGDDLCLKEIILGCNSSVPIELRDKILNRFPEIEIKQARMSTIKYSIEI